MKVHNGNCYDVAIIGAGISGLVCGCYLAKAGMKVLIIEQHDKPGGYCSSFRRGRFIFDAAAHSFGSYREGGNFREIIRELGIDGVVKISRFNPSDIIVTPDFKITFWNDTSDTIADLKKVFPGQKENIESFYAYYNNSASQNKFDNITLKDSTFASFLKSFFSDDTLMNAISLPVLGNGGLPPSLITAFTGTKIYREFLIDGGYYPEGGMQMLPNAFAQRIKESNGTILYRKPVKKILYRNNSVQGVDLDNNESFISKYVVSACDATETFKRLLGPEAAGKDIINKLIIMKPSISTFTLYLGLDKPFDGLPQEGANIWYLPYYDLDKMFKYIEAGDPENFSGGGFMFRLSPDKKTILAFYAAPFKSSVFWEQNKRKIADDLFKRLGVLIPNLKDHVIHFEMATPFTLHRYTLNHEGANYGWAPLQSQLFDPDFRQKTFINGLYLTGHWTCHTHGIPGVAYLGYSTAKLILKKEKLI